MRKKGGKEMSEYDYFYCPGCSTYRDKKYEHIVSVAHMTNNFKRQTHKSDALNNFYTVCYSFLCEWCKRKAEMSPAEYNKGS